MKHKKSQVGPTLTWVIALFVISFIMFVAFLIWSLMGSISKTISSENGKVISQDIDPVLFDNFLFFLNSPLEFKGKKTSFYEVILSSINEKDNEELGSLIKKELDNYCSQYRLLIPEGLVTEKGFIKKSDILDMNIFSNTNDLLYAWTPVIKYEVYYRGDRYEILYRQLKECGGEEIKSE